MITLASINSPALWSMVLSVPLQVQKWLIPQGCHFADFSKPLQTPCHLLRRLTGHSLLSFPLPSRKALPPLWNLCFFSYFFYQAALGTFHIVTKFSHSYLFERYPSAWHLADLQYSIIQWMNVISFISRSLENSDASHAPTHPGSWMTLFADSTMMQKKEWKTILWVCLNKADIFFPLRSCCCM